MDEGDTKGTFGKLPRNWNGISRFVKDSDGTKESLTGDTVAFLWWFSKGAFSISLVHFSLDSVFAEGVCLARTRYDVDQNLCEDCFVWECVLCMGPKALRLLYRLRLARR